MHTAVTVHTWFELKFKGSRSGPSSYSLKAVDDACYIRLLQYLAAF